MFADLASSPQVRLSSPTNTQGMKMNQLLVTLLAESLPELDTLCVYPMHVLVMISAAQNVLSWSCNLMIIIT